MQPKVTVCIPVYNVAGFLASCLKSVVSQTLTNIEIVCVEDASTDNSAIILKEYAEKDSRIRIIRHENNAGTHKTRKDAALSARGKYIMFLDGDDELYPNACEVAYEAIERNRADAVNFGVQEIDFQGNYIITRQDNLTEDIGRIEENWLYLYDKRIIKSWAVWNKIYKTDLCKNAFMQTEDSYIVIAEDMYYFFVFGYFAKSFSMIKDVLYKYRNGVGVFGGIPGKFGLDTYKVLLSEKKALDALTCFYKGKQDEKNYNPVIQKYVKEAFLRQAVLWWHDKLQDKDKVSGLQILEDIWGNEMLTHALQILSENLDKRINNLQKNKAGLQKEKAKLQKEKKQLQKELSAIKTSKGYKVLQKYYHIKDSIMGQRK